MRLLNLSDAIDRFPWTISPDSTVIEAIGLMNRKRNIKDDLTSLNFSFESKIGSQQGSSCILVMEGTQLLGIFTYEDVVRLVTSGMDLSRAKMAQVMTQQVVTLTQSNSQDIFTALSLLHQHQIRHLPILDNVGQLLGIVTETSLLELFLLEEEKFTDQEKVNEELQQTLEELQVVSEELRQQNEELTTARNTSELQQQRYQDLFEFAPDGYLVTNSVGIIQEANNAAATLLCVSQKSLVGKPLIVFIAQQDRQIFRAKISNLQPLQDWEIYLYPRGGTPFPASIRASIVYNSSHQQVGWRWLLCNISERKQAQELLHRAKDELEKRVRQRTEELVKANEELQTEITERKRAELQLLHLAFHDALTGLPNRSAFIKRLEHAINYSKRHEDYLFAVLFLDLDGFKSINDSLGHRFGDQLLLVIAQRLQECLRSIDVGARLGGDEFIILLEGIKDINDAINATERIQHQLTLPVELDGQEVFTTVSIGIVLSSTNYNQPEEFLRDADIAMYRAKAQGKACYEIFNTDMHIQAVSQLQLENALRRAIERFEFRIYYQPIVLLKTGKIIGFEALVRWLHPKLGIVLPEYFMSTAQSTGLISRIDEWVLDEACRQTQQWQERFSQWSNLEQRPLTISVNLCSTKFSQQNLLPQINQVLQKTGLDAQSLTLEITETVIMENSDKATIKLKQLRKLGIKLAIDDFGTGYSSLGRLHHFPINQLKIDRSFVSGGSVAQGNLDIVETMVILSKKLGVDVIAEGVETAEQLALLKAMKCEYGQGNFFSRPLDNQAAAALIIANPLW
ncbi:MAG: EAL domain-containing protein [Nostoc sp.]|uniref:EAL domain-containing protein n=1 Tax=Nostoc sp. TaxID=1180 RepID=UPI002FF84679